MPDPTLVHVTVTFEIGTGHDGFTYAPLPAEGVTFSGTPVAHATLSGSSEVPHNYAFIYTLDGPGVGDTLVWHTPPIVWETEQPPQLESGFTLPTPEANQVVVGVFNDNTSTQTETFGFRLKVIKDEQIHESPDPEIILDPPSP
jgi:hypothetical protein